MQRNMRGEVENMGEDVDTQQELPVHVVHVTHIHDMYININVILSTVPPVSTGTHVLFLIKKLFFVLLHTCT